ncbi:succinate dehydrogenase assembly factor 2 [Pelagibacterium montanilacus]|uniref:FAD assembly factor SdhE n=1 Tax=Pelagibacterium montanilacus TaxID=2185280 RepID=UPI001FEB79D8|nr:succinate dehydrogenase assembly factor 2 [Pelagibacterium montanilacus]
MTMAEHDDLETRRRRMLYRSTHRGTQELDILVGEYVRDRLADLDHAALDRIEGLLDEEETELQAWLMGQDVPPAGVDAELIAEIRAARIGKVTP